MLKFIIPIALAVLFFAQLAEAQTFDRRFTVWQRPAFALADYEQREARQREAIRSGIESGEITRHEARRLWDEQRRIERMESRFEADGRVTPRERAQLDRALDRSGRNIWRESHDRERVGAYGDHRGWRSDHHGFPNADARHNRIHWGWR